MGKYLAYTSPARGHLYPIVDTLLELRDRGHEVAVRTLASEVARMQQLGFSAAPVAPAIEAIEPDDWQARTPIGANTRLLKTFARRAEHETADIQAAIDELRSFVARHDDVVPRPGTRLARQLDTASRVIAAYDREAGTVSPRRGRRRAWT